VKCARRAKILQDRQLTNTRSVLASRVSFNLLTPDADGVRFDRSREFDELDDMRDLLENAVFLASSRCLLLGGKQTFEKSR
jgi:hypothetical protein